MSADDGIYILITKGDTEEHPLEYRVSWAMAIENLVESDTGFSSWYANDIFGKSDVHFELNEALEKAIELLRNQALTESFIEAGELVYLAFPEYGIEVKDYSDYPFPQSGER